MACKPRAGSQGQARRQPPPSASEGTARDILILDSSLWNRESEFLSPALCGIALRLTEQTDERGEMEHSVLQPAERLPSAFLLPPSTF